MKKRIFIASVFIVFILLLGLVSCSSAGNGEILLPDDKGTDTAAGSVSRSDDDTVGIIIGGGNEPEISTAADKTETSDTDPPGLEVTDVELTETETASDEDTAVLTDTVAVSVKPAETDKAEPKEPVEKNGKKAYLTFDDGPHKENTAKILDILDEYGVKATFFTVGKRVEIYGKQLKMIRDAGHAVGCHSYDHDYSRLKTPEGVKDEISEWESAAEKALGEIPEEKLFRFPGGSPVKDENDCRGQVAALGYRGYDWNCLDNDCLIKSCPEGKDVEEWMKESFLNTYKYGSSIKGAPLIILAHETYTETVDILSWMIEFLQSEGYDFGTLDEVDTWYY